MPDIMPPALSEIDVPPGPTDLTNCDREPIHIPGAIQPHGCLLACDAALTVIRRASANAAAIFGLPPRDLAGARFDAVFGEKLTHDIRNALARSSEPAEPGLLFGEAFGAARFDIAAHFHKGESIIEFEPRALVGTDTTPLETARTLIGRLGKLDDPDKLVAATARLLRGLLGYDRVMIYRFSADGSGEVISEARRSDLESFLGQHFPATDIPQQARALYIANMIRVISDVSSAPVAVSPRLLSGEPLDLSFAHLRAVSPIHCEYLRNMGVAASMSLTIMVDGAFWGLVACHHYSPRALPLSQRVSAETFARFFSMKMESLNVGRSMAFANAARRALDELLQHISHHGNFAELLRDHLPRLKQLMPCNGLGVWIDDQWSMHGAGPPEEAMPGLMRFVTGAAGSKVWATHALSDNCPPARSYVDRVAGVLAIPLSQTPRDYLLFFRPEVIQTVNWAGNPNKTYETGPLGDRLTPRKSFALWKQTVERQSLPWSERDREIAEASRAALVEIVMRYNEMLADERSKADVRHKILNEELNHRVKNILALIKSLVSHPVDEARPLRDYVRSLRGRIQALAFAHDQVVRSSGGGALTELLRAELSPYRDDPNAVLLEGPAVQLDSRAFSVLALVLHELATNAAKYGALSRRSGRLSVRWQVLDIGDCEIQWREEGGPPVTPPSRQGFGSVLLGRSIPYDLGGVSTIDYARSGVTARFVIPARYVARDFEEAEPLLAAGKQSGRAMLPEGLNVLLVEDQLIIALDAEAMLLALGAKTVETAASVGEAKAVIARFTPDIAVLDINLGTDTSWPIVEALRDAGVPCVLASGYGDLTAIPGRWSGLPIVRKPYESAALAAALAEALGAQHEADQ